MITENDENPVVARIGVLPGDGIGPEVTTEAVRVLRRVALHTDIELTFVEGLLGGAAIEKCGSPLPQETLELCRSSDALLVGAVGGTEWDSLPAESNPGPGGLLRLRRDLNLFANIRPAKTYVADFSPLRETNVDILLIREAVGGLYFSRERGSCVNSDGEVAWDTMEYSAEQIHQVARVAFQLAGQRDGKLVSVDKSNVLESSKLWRRVIRETAIDFPDIELENLYVDNCALQLLLRPQDFDVIVTENLFGDILSDEIAGIVGSLGLLPSASLRADTFGLYEPVHGAAPDIAGTDTANPAAAILSAALLLRYSLARNSDASRIELAVSRVLKRKIWTTDLARNASSAVSTRAFTDAVLEEIDGLYGVAEGVEGEVHGGTAK